MFTLKFATDNAAFEGEALEAECARLLRQIAKRLEVREEATGTIMDANGNYVGTWTLS